MRMMAPPPPPPPATPHRFLHVPRRTTTTTTTPGRSVLQGTGTGSGNQQQFQATPRFSSLQYSTPRGGAGAGAWTHTPFFRPRSGGYRDRGRDDAALLSLRIDSSPPESQEEDQTLLRDDDDEEEEEKVDGDSTIVDEDEDELVLGGVEEDEEEGLSMYGGGGGGGGGGEEGSEDERLTKRRRLLSLSSENEAEAEVEAELQRSESPSYGREEEGNGEDVEMVDTYPPSSPRENISFHEPTSREPPGVQDSRMDMTAEAADSSGNYYNERQRRTTQPKFHKPPRFKPVEVPEAAASRAAAAAAEPLPDTFSPRRKGAKYMPGGLAAELREWLVDVEAGVGSISGLSLVGNREGVHWAARIIVEELRSGGRGMTLVTGRLLHVSAKPSHMQVHEGGGGEGEEGLSQSGNERLPTLTPTNTVVRVILAGQGRLSGLGVGSEVKLGVVIGVARPTWEVTLDDGRWGVACDWAVL
ncbi:hypothetical protein F5Y17DRAFT_274099 [Xylariaceae sp. FL0594]|nr:hypothetical protein F5Y17DRAFT_274099 [Xylariaceae sp. FL0594]